MFGAHILPLAKFNHVFCKSFAMHFDKYIIKMCDGVKTKRTTFRNRMCWCCCLKERSKKKKKTREKERERERDRDEMRIVSPNALSSITKPNYRDFGRNHFSLHLHRVSGRFKFGWTEWMPNLISIQKVTEKGPYAAAIKYNNNIHGWKKKKMCRWTYPVNETENYIENVLKFRDLCIELSLILSHSPSNGVFFSFLRLFRFQKCIYYSYNAHISSSNFVTEIKSETCAKINVHSHSQVLHSQKMLESLVAVNPFIYLYVS